MSKKSVYNNLPTKLQKILNEINTRNVNYPFSFSITRGDVMGNTSSCTDMHCGSGVGNVSACDDEVCSDPNAEPGVMGNESACSDWQCGNV